jgi:replicative DNA helicase
MHREDYYHRGEEGYSPTNVTDAIVAKQRNGPIDTVALTFLAECVRFENAASEHTYGGGY